MNILQICKKMPVPAKDGEALAILNIIKLLVQQQAKLTLLALATQKHPGSLSNLPDKIKQSVNYNQCEINTNFKAWAFIKSIVKGSAYTLNRFHSKAFEALIIQALQSKKFNIIQLEGLYLLPYLNIIKKHSNAKIVLRAHNVEHHVWQNLASNSSNFFKKIAYQYNANSIKQIELKPLQHIDAIISISTTDQAFFQEKQKATSIINLPFGINLDEYKTVRPAIEDSLESISLSFIGSLDWLPNIEGLHWFLDEVWPIVHQQFPKTKFHIAGRNMQTSIKRITAPNVIIKGEVNCAKTFIAAHQIFIVPLLSGSGMRIKIIEAMALEAAVISTPLGASGIQYTNKTDILIGQTAHEFANSIITLLKNEIQRKRIAKNGRQLVEKHYNNATLSKRLIEFYRTLCN